MTASSTKEERRGGNPGAVSNPIRTKELNVTIIPQADVDPQRGKPDMTTAKGKPAWSVALNAETTPTEVDWAAEHLAHLPLLVDVSPNPDRVVSHWRDSTGFRWRKPGQIIVTWEPNSSMRFRIWLNSGAGTKDLEWLEARVQDARDGRFGNRFGWVRADDPRGYEIWRYTYSRPVGHSLKEYRRLSPEQIIACDEPRCRESIHQVWDLDEGVTHTADEIETEHWKLVLERFSRNSKWVVYTGPFETELTPDDCASFANDLQWLAAEARRLNAVDDFADLLQVAA